MQARKHSKEDSKGGFVRLEVKLLNGTDVILQLVCPASWQATLCMCAQVTLPVLPTPCSLQGKRFHVWKVLCQAY